jgi:phage tail-like protein
MAERADGSGRPYSQFNFLVDFNGDTGSPQAGFQEVSGLGAEINVAEYRAGNWSENSARKVYGTYKSTDVTLKRGLIGTRDLFEWVQAVREGGPDQRREVVITLQSEDRQETAAVWTLIDAFPTKYTAPTLSGNGTDLAIEELTLACERINMEEEA